MTNSSNDEDYSRGSTVVWWWGVEWPALALESRGLGIRRRRRRKIAVARFRRGQC